MKTPTLAEFSALRLPVIVAPMFLVSGPELVISAAKWGVVGAMPTLNARDADTLDRWLLRIRQETSSVRGTFAINLVVHNKYARMQADLDLIVKHEVPYVITSIGSPVRLFGACMPTADGCCLMLRPFDMQGWQSTLESTGSSFFALGLEAIPAG